MKKRSTPLSSARQTPKKRSLKASASQAGLLACLLAPCLFASGCASPGPPRAPSLHLPALATGITAERNGDQVLLTWTSPDRTSDGLPLKEPFTAEICRETGPRATTPVARRAACQAVLRLPVDPTAGREGHATDRLPTALLQDPPTLLTYRIQLFNAQGRSAGESTDAGFTAAGAAPPRIEDLRGSNLKPGAVLEWTPLAPSQGAPGLIELTRVDLTPPRQAQHAGQKPKAAAAPAQHDASHAPAKEREKPGQPATSSAPASPSVHLRVQERAAASPATPTGTIDQDVRFGQSYQYIAERVRTVTLGGHSLEIHSAASAPVTVARLDTFPPPAPEGLAAVPGSDPQAPAAIDLSWEPVPVDDIVGYLVFRRLADGNGAPPVQLTAVPVAAPAFRDLTAVPGQRYVYQVVAVDDANNHSSLSAPAAP